MLLSFKRSLTVGRRMTGPAAACALASGLLLLGPAAEAQQPSPSTKTATPPAAAEPSPARLAAARELVVASGMTRSFDAVVPQMMRQLAQTYTQTRPELAPDLKAIFQQIRPEFDKTTDEMVDKSAHILAKLLSDQDIKVAVAFFTSEAGKKYVQVQPYFFDDIVNAMQDWHQRIEAQLVTRVRAELKKRGHTL